MEPLFTQNYTNTLHALLSLHIGIVTYTDTYLCKSSYVVQVKRDRYIARRLLGYCCSRQPVPIVVRSAFAAIC